MFFCQAPKLSLCVHLWLLRGSRYFGSLCAFMVASAQQVLWHMPITHILDESLVVLTLVSRTHARMYVLVRNYKDLPYYISLLPDLVIISISRIQ